MTNKYVKLVEDTISEGNTTKGIESYLTKDLKGKGVWKNDLSDDEIPFITKLTKQGKLSSTYDDKKDDYLLKWK
jgi:hypothetical protein